jgi:hypothetical protein
MTREAQWRPWSDMRGRPVVTFSCVCSLHCRGQPDGSFPAMDFLCKPCRLKCRRPSRSIQWDLSRMRHDCCWRKASTPHIVIDHERAHAGFNRSAVAIFLESKRTERPVRQFPLRTEAAARAASLPEPHQGTAALRRQDLAVYI